MDIFPPLPVGLPDELIPTIRPVTEGCSAATWPEPLS
jgi:hypothetical protein